MCTHGDQWMDNSHRYHWVVRQYEWGWMSKAIPRYPLYQHITSCAPGIHNGLAIAPLLGHNIVEKPWTALEYPIVQVISRKTICSFQESDNATPWLLATTSATQAIAPRKPRGKLKNLKANSNKWKFPKWFKFQLIDPYGSRSEIDPSATLELPSITKSF